VPTLLLDAPAFTTEEIYEDAYDYVDTSLDEEEVEVEDNDEYFYGGYGSHFDSYSGFDSNDYEYQQALYY
jgi:hypothetical protein